MRKKLGRPRKDRTLSAEQRQVLEDLFYTEFRGAVGLHALNAALREHPEQKRRLDAGQPGFVTWRDLKLWYNSQTVTQVMRRAPTVSETRASMPRTLEPLALLQADVIDMGDLAFNRQRYVLNIVDVVTGFSIQQTWQGGLNTRQTARVVTEYIDVIRSWLGSWPAQTELRCDNGQEFGDAFADAVQTYEPQIKVTHGVPNRPNSQAVAENSNATWRGVARRLLRSQGLPQTRWPQHLAEIGYIMNSRPSGRLGWISPADAFNAFFGDTDEDRETVARVVDAIKRAVAARRGPGARGADKPYPVGAQVRLADARWLKSDLKGNVAKQGPKWSVTVHTVTRRRRPGPGAPHEYRIDDGSGVWHAHELLQHIPGAEAPPAAATADRDEYRIEKVLRHDPVGTPDTSRPYLVLYTGYAWPEWVPASEVPANLR